MGRVWLGVADCLADKYRQPVLKRCSPIHGSVKIELCCEQSACLIPRVGRGELDLALVSRDSPKHGTLLFHEPVVWVGSPQFEIWRRDPLPIAVYESTSLAKRSAIKSLALQGREYRSEEHTSELQSLMRISYAVFCLKKQNKTHIQHNHKRS